MDDMLFLLEERSSSSLDQLHADRPATLPVWACLPLHEHCRQPPAELETFF
jgi:hypothetical protein